jgi:hypothetical protein
VLAGADLPGLGTMSPEDIEQTAVLDPQGCWRVAAGATPARVRRVARRVLTALDAKRPERRRRNQPEPADIVAYPTRPGWMILGLEMPEADGCTAQARLHGLARLLKTRPGETRHLGQLRVQAFRDLLFGHTPPSPGPDGPGGLSGPGGPDGPGGGSSPYDGLGDPHPGAPVCPPAWLPVPAPFDVHLTIDATGQESDSRYGLLTPGTVQDIVNAARAAGGVVHTRLVTPVRCPGSHPDAVQLAADPDPRFPHRALAATVRMRDQHCRFPGCTLPATRTDLDHSIPWPHGPTCGCNLCALCRHHHRLKTHGRWKTTNHGNGHLTWTTPTGRVIEVGPDP